MHIPKSCYTLACGRLLRVEASLDDLVEPLDVHDGFRGPCATFGDSIHPSLKTEDELTEVMRHNYYVLTDGVCVAVEESTPQLLQREVKGGVVSLALLKTNEGTIPHQLICSQSFGSPSIQLVHEMLRNEFDTIDSCDLDGMELVPYLIRQGMHIFIFKVPRVVQIH